VIAIALSTSALVALSLTAAAAPPSSPCATIPPHAVIAHRGASHDAPEETATAYRKARAMNADYFEMDIQRTKDGKLIALHDASFDRTTDIATKFPDLVGAPPNRVTWAQVQQLDAGSWFNAAHADRAHDDYRGARVLSLDDVIDIAEEKGANMSRLYIETKEPERYPGIEDDIVALLAKRGWLKPDFIANGRVVFQSFSAASLKKLALLAPSVPRVYLVDEDNLAKEGSLDKLVEVARDVGCGIGPKGTMALQLSAHAHERGLVVHPWVLDEGWQLALAKTAGIDGVFTNRPDAARISFAGDDATGK
jgi:glycerophosphoryl diester phosphodiesterase